MIDQGEMRSFFKTRVTTRPPVEIEMQSFMKGSNIEITRKPREELNDGVNFSGSVGDDGSPRERRSQETSNSDSRSTSAIN